MQATEPGTSTENLVKFGRGFWDMGDMGYGTFLVLAHPDNPRRNTRGPCVYVCVCLCFILPSRQTYRQIYIHTDRHADRNILPFLDHWWII